MVHKSAPRPLRILALLAALLPLGCNLSDYTGHMAAEAERARYWDRESELLGRPINMPELPKIKKGDKEQEQVWEVFLRLPRGISESPTLDPAGGQNATKAQLFGPQLVQYVNTGNKFGIQAVYLGVVPADTKDYESKVCSHFGVTAGGETGWVVPRALTLRTSTGRQSSLEVNLKTKTVAGATTSGYSINFYEHDGNLVVVVFQLEKDNGQKADEPIKASLATLGEGIEGGRLRDAYRRANRPLNKK